MAGAHVSGEADTGKWWMEGGLFCRKLSRAGAHIALNPVTPFLVNTMHLKLFGGFALLNRRADKMQVPLISLRNVRL